MIALHSRPGGGWLLKDGLRCNLKLRGTDAAWTEVHYSHLPEAIALLQEKEVLLSARRLRRPALNHRQQAGRLRQAFASEFGWQCSHAGTYHSTDSWKRVASQIEAESLAPWRSRARPDRQTITQNNRPLRVRLDGGKQMRIPPNQVLFLGQRQWAEFDRSQEPLPDEIRILLWLMDGAERRHRLASRWSGKEPRRTYPIVSFDDLALEPSGPEIRVAREPWPEAVLTAFERIFEAATQGALLLHREMIDIAQRNVNASFGFLRRLAGAKNLGEMLDLEATYWRVQSDALMGQAEELRALTTKAAADMAGPIDAHVPSSIHDMRKAS